MMSTLPRTLMPGGITQRAHALLRESPCSAVFQPQNAVLPTPFSIRQYTTTQSKLLLSRSASIPTRRIPQSSCYNTSFSQSPRSFGSSSPTLFNSTPSLKPDEGTLNPYKAKRVWPPDMTKLSSKQQFRLERKYRRRSKLKYERPVWSKWTKLVQWGLIGFVFVYCTLFMELGTGRANPFQSLRNFVFGFLDDTGIVEGKPSKDTAEKPKAQ